MSDVRLGEIRSTRMRRIGERHMIVMPAQQAQVLSVEDIQRKIGEARQQRFQLTQRLGPLDKLITDLEQQLVAFHALPIERDADDPEVPQPPAPVPVPLPVAPPPARVPQPDLVVRMPEPPVLTDS